MSAAILAGIGAGAAVALLLVLLLAGAARKIAQADAVISVLPKHKLRIPMPPNVRPAKEAP